MALSMEEQRILSEIASQLGREDPRLAERMAGFGRARHRRRVRTIVAVIISIVMIAAIVAAAYVAVPS